MKKLKKIISDKEWKHKLPPLQVFENRLKDMMNLEVLTISSKLSDSAKNEAKKQYLIMLVTCYETYLREIFKEIIRDKLAPFSKVIKLKKLRKIQFSFEELDFIRTKSIELPELVCEYINFQNFKEIMEAFSIIGLDSKINKKMEEKDGIVPPPRKEILDAGDGANAVNEFYKEIAIHKKIFNKLGLFSQIELLLKARHKIIHQNISGRYNDNDCRSLRICHNLG